MKRLFIFFLALMPLFLSAQADQVPFETIRAIADRNAQAIWGDVSPTDPIPYFGLDDEIIAWRFNYSIGKPFPEYAEMLAERKFYIKNGDNLAQWGSEKYGRYLISAREDLPVVLERSASLSPEFAECVKMEIMKNNAFEGEPAELQKVWYFDHFNTWYEYKSGDIIKYINLSPTGGIIDHEEFLTRKLEAEYFIQPGDFSKDWEKYESGFTSSTDDINWIPLYAVMPFYDWSYGCSPTAGAMLLAYWDYLSYYEDDNYSGFVSYHFQRYDTIDDDEYDCHWDYNVPNLQKALALAMGTDTISGSTWPHMMDDGYVHVCNSILDYSFGIDSYYTLHWTRTTGEIDAGRPIHIDVSGHTVCGVGYDDDENLVICRYTWDNVYTAISRYSMLHLVTVHPGGPQGVAVYLRKPFGDPRYNEDGNGELLLGGDFYEISWRADKYHSTTSADLFYSIDGGYNWELIVLDALNSTTYNWEVPTGINSDDCRVMIYIQDTECAPRIAGADGSYGNFKIHSGGSVRVLFHMDLNTAEEETEYFRFDHNHPSWAIVGAFPETSDCTWSCELWDEDFGTKHAESYYSSVRQNFVVLDGNHLPVSTYGIKTRPLAYDTTVYVQYEGDNETLSLTPGGSVQLVWFDNYIVEMKDIHLTPGQYYFEMKKNWGTMDLDMAFFSSTDGDYYKTINDADYISDNFGSLKESFVVNIETEDDYGICFFAKERGEGSFTVKILEAYTWTGNESFNWHDPDNWSGHLVPDMYADVVIGNSTNDPRIFEADAVCNNMNILYGASLTIVTNDLFVYGDLFVNSEIEITNPSSIIRCYEDVTVATHSAMSFVDGSGMYVAGDWTFGEGSSQGFNEGFVKFYGDENSMLYVKSENSWFNDLKIGKTDGAFVAYDNTPYLQPLRIKGQFVIYDGATFIQYALYNTIFEGPFLAYAGSHFAFAHGKAIFDFSGGGGIAIYSEPGSYFNDLTASCFGWLGLGTDIEIRGDLLIEEGMFKTLGHDVYIKGNWTDNSGFNHGNSRVIFNGTGNQFVNGENFWEMEIDKPSGELRFSEFLTSVQHYDWTQGTIRVNGGTFHAMDLEDNGIYGTIILTDGQIDLHQDPGNYIDLRGNLEISGGIMNVYGGSEVSYWPYITNASITMSDGILDFKSKGISIRNSGSASFTSDISGGMIRTSQGFEVLRSDFQPTGGTFEFYGYDEDADLFVQDESHLFTIVVDKSSKGSSAIAKTLTATGSLDLNGDFILNGGNFEAPDEMYVAGLFSNNQTPNHFDELTGEVILDGTLSYNMPGDEVFYDLTVNTSGTMTVTNTNTLTVTNMLNINNGILYFEPSTELIVQGGVAVNYGGALHFIGEALGQISVNSAFSGNYTFDINAGGEIAAEYTIFTYMAEEGINLHSGAFVVPDMAFNNCNFAYGLPGGTLLTINTGADMVIHNAYFLTNTTGMLYNVVKTVDNGNVYFDEAYGDFSGAAFENDPYNRIHWEYIPPFELPFFEDWASGDFETNIWTPTGSNWVIDEVFGNGLPSAKFNYSPRVYNYSQQLRSFQFDAAGLDEVFLSYDIAYDEYQAGTMEQMSVRIVYPGGDYFSLANYTNSAGSFDFLTEGIDISGYAAGEIFMISFVAQGEDSWNINKWNIDNIEIIGLMPEPGKLTGNVKDNSTGDPIENALVVLDGTAYSATTNNTGDFVIENIPPGNYTVTVSAAGYDTYVGMVEIEAGAATYQTFPLTPIPPSYCTDSLYSVGCIQGDGLQSFGIGALYNGMSGCSPEGYGDFTDMTVELGQGYLHQTILHSNYMNQMVSLWIDFDNDFEFEDSERLLTDFELKIATQFYVTDVMIPGDAPTGSHRLRVRTNWYESSADPCAEYNYGEAEDYTAIIISGIQYGHVSGSVTDAVSLEPVSGAEIRLGGTEYFGITEDEGICIISSVPSAYYDIIASAGGYVSDTIFNVYVYWGQIAYADFELEQLPPVIHSLDIPAGWSGISSYVMPYDEIIENIFYPAFTDLIILQTMDAMFWPAMQINTIQAWQSQSAYKIKMNEEVNLIISGQYETNKTVDLDEGWSLLPVICDGNVPVADLFDGIATEMTLVKEVAGIGVYWPFMGINSLQMLYPGKSYFAHINIPGSVTFPENSAKSGSLNSNNQFLINNPWNKVKTVPNSHLFVFPSNVLTEVSTGQGDFIGAFTNDGLCAGIIEVEKSRAEIIAIFGDDPMTMEKDGFNEGEEIQFRIYKISEEKEYELSVIPDPSYPNSDLLFNSNGISVVDDMFYTLSSTGDQTFENIRIFPNPSDGFFHITGLMKNTKITVFSPEGVEIYFTTSENPQIQLNLSAIPKGVYFVKLENAGTLRIKKIVIR